MTRILIARRLFASLAAFALTPAAQAVEPINKTYFGNLALGGYDAVAYFDEGKPVEGKKEIATEWNGAMWRFATADHRDRFRAEPEKYAPQYGGYCAWAVSQGYTANGDPKVWRIVDGKLYLNYDEKVMRTWEEDVPGNIAKADQAWPKLLAE